MTTVSQKEEEISLLSPVITMKCRKILKGHRGRVLHFDWSPDKSHVLTAGQVGGICRDFVADGFVLLPQFTSAYTSVCEQVGVVYLSRWGVACVGCTRCTPA